MSRSGLEAGQVCRNRFNIDQGHRAKWLVLSKKWNRNFRIYGLVESLVGHISRRFARPYIPNLMQPEESHSKGVRAYEDVPTYL